MLKIFIIPPTKIFWIRHWVGLLIQNDEILVICRGGVEDTRLEAKNTKKNPRPRTAFPRTDTLEAKDRNARGQGPRTQSAGALQKKKKVFTKIFQAISKKKKKKKGLHKKFSSDLH